MLPIHRTPRLKGQLVKNRIQIGLVLSALLLAACGAGVTEAQETTTTSASVDTTQAVETTTTAPPATTTTPAPTTTTEVADSEVATLMASLQESNSSLSSARIEGTIEMTGVNQEATGLSEMVVLFNTAFDATTGDSSFLIDMSSLADSTEVQELEGSEDPFADMAAGFLGEMEFRQIGDRAFMKIPFFIAMFGAETDWISMPAEEGDEFTNTFETVPFHPTEILEAYESAAATLEDLGVETVNGVEATHYRIRLNTEEMEMTPEERAELEASGLFAQGIIPMDIWVSEEGYTVRMILEIDGTGLDAPPEEEFETMRMQYDLLDVNEDIVIEPPPASEVTDIEDLEGSFLGLDPEE